MPVSFRVKRVFKNVNKNKRAAQQTQIIKLFTLFSISGLKFTDYFKEVFDMDYTNQQLV